MNVQQLHYTIDTFELNYEATPLTLGAPTTSSNSYFPRRLANKGHKNLLSGTNFGGLTGGGIMGNLTSIWIITLISITRIIMMNFSC